MNALLQRVLADIEADAGADVGQTFTSLVAEYFANTRAGTGRVSTARGPSDLAARFDEPIPVHGRPVAEVVARLEHDVLPDCNRLMHPRAMGHQVSAPLPVAIWTETLTAALNQSAAVWEMSPVGTVIEARVVRWLCDLAGFGPAAGGTFTSGGTEATSRPAGGTARRTIRTPGGTASAQTLRWSCVESMRTTRRARDRTAGPRHRPRGRRPLARLPHGCRGTRANTRGLTPRAGR